MFKKLVVFIFLFVLGAYSNDQSVEKDGKNILEKSDLRLIPLEGTYELTIGLINDDTRKKQYTIQVYKQNNVKITSIWVYPEIMQNTVSMRAGNAFYYKPLKAFRPEIYSYKSIFLNSGLSWADIMTIDLVGDYKTVKIDSIKEQESKYYILQLAPLTEDKYARIDVWVDQNTFNTKKRIYYTASGEKMKETIYSDIEVIDGVVKNFKIEMTDFFMETKNYGEYSKISKVSLPKFLFDINNIGRIHKQ